MKQTLTQIQEELKKMIKIVKQMQKIIKEIEITHPN